MAADENTRRDRRRKLRTGMGVLLTLAWVALWAAAVWGDILPASVVDKREALTLNAWGDVFAGTVAPIAFLWLILGYFQQGDELEQNTEALRAQVAETAELVKEYARLADVTASAKELDYQSMLETQRPDLRLHSAGATGPGGHPKLLHLWPGQTPPPGRRRDEATLLG
jgi:hypothetical protein